MASFPSSVWSGNTRGTNLSDAHTHTKWHDDIMGEVVAIQTELGTNPSGALSTVALRVRQTDSLCQVRQSGGQSIAHNTVVTLNFNTEDLDPLGWHDNVTNNHRITPTVAGWYQSSFGTSWQADADYTFAKTVLRKNGTEPTVSQSATAVVSLGDVDANAGLPLMSMNGTTDYLDLVVFQTNTSAGTNTVDVTWLVKLVYAT